MGLNTYKILLSLERLGYKFDNCQVEVKQHRNCVSPWKGHEKSFDLVGSKHKIFKRVNGTHKITNMGNIDKN